jgi:phosphomannomutase
MNKNVNIAKFFKAYDLRATTPELSWEIYYLSAKGLVETILKPESLPLQVTVWHDARLTSSEFYKAFINGLSDSGCLAIPCGMGSTDMMYASAIDMNISGAMITASHNPKDDNGLKIVKSIPQMLGLSTGLDKIRDYVIANIDSLDIRLEDLKEVKDDVTKRNNSVNYLTKIAKQIGKIELNTDNKQFKIVVDSGNGMGSVILPILKELYPLYEFVPLYCDLDGTFPNHPADPINPDNMLDLQQAVKDNKADLGIAFDGDADRAFFVDENGELINGENLVAVFAQEFVKEVQTQTNPKFNPAVAYVMSYSRALPDAVLAQGGVAIPSKQGHTFVKSEMKKYNAIYGGEASGHHYFGEFGFMDSGLMACVMLMRIINNKAIPSSRVCEYFEANYNMSGEYNLKVSPSIKLQDVVAKIIKLYPEGLVNTQDGVSIFYNDFKFTIRGSNTEPLFRINVETRVINEKINPQTILNNIIKSITN